MGKPGVHESTLVEVLLALLKRESIRTVFGLPGGGIYPLFRALEDDADFRIIVARHESAAAFMADGFARVSPELGQDLAMVAVTSGPGAINALNGVALAFAEGVPLLVVTGQAPTRVVGKGASQETSAEDIDIVGMYRPITKYSAGIGSPERLPHHFCRALRAARSGRPGPVHLQVPVDFWDRPLELDEGQIAHTGRLPALFDRDAVRDAAAALVAAKHPLFLVGSGAAGSLARRHVETLADQINALVATTPRAKGLFPETSSRSLGVLGFGGHESAKRHFLGDEADLVFLIGASMNETSTYNWDPGLARGRTVIQLDIEPEIIGRNYPVDIPLPGNAGTILLELSYALGRLLEAGHKPASRWTPAHFATWDEGHFRNPDHRSSDELPLRPERWRVELQAALPENAIIFSDIGGHTLFNMHHLRIGPGQRFIANVGYGSMGHGTVAAIGAALSQPDRPVVSIIGDEGFLMHGMEMFTAREQGARVHWIVENNQAHGMIVHGSRMLSAGRTLRCSFNRTRHDLSGFAQGLGLPFWKVDKPGQMAGTFTEALQVDGPTFIEVAVDVEVAPPIGERVQGISGFKV